MVGSVQVNAAIGPGRATAGVGAHLAVGNVERVELDLEHEIGRLFHDGSKVTEFSLVGITGISTTITGVTGSAVSFEID
jgi:hypothetical protein